MRRRTPASGEREVAISAAICPSGILRPRERSVATVPYGMPAAPHQAFRLACPASTISCSSSSGNRQDTGTPKNPIGFVGGGSAVLPRVRLSGAGGLQERTWSQKTRTSISACVSLQKRRRSSCCRSSRRPSHSTQDEFDLFIRIEEWSLVRSGFSSLDRSPAQIDPEVPALPLFQRGERVGPPSVGCTRGTRGVTVGHPSFRGETWGHRRPVDGYPRPRGPRRLWGTPGAPVACLMNA